ncbi:MAG: hypothetical protein ACRC3Y_07055 [Romboutsia sp.]|uniref:hypothetical protein n=1 Tax=Romboutsia sp. TaxID=1965302 RepID=UPI003F345918
MAHGQYIVIEKIELEIIEECLKKMTESNFIDDENLFLDHEKFENNIKNGIVIVTMLKTYLDTSISYICNNRNIKIKQNIFQTIKELYKENESELLDIEEKTEYKLFEEMNNIRNNFIHFKNNYLGDSTGIPLKGNGNSNFISGKELYKYFIKSKMNEVINGIQKLIKDIAEQFGFVVNNECRGFMSDGKDGKVSYLIECDKNE